MNILIPIEFFYTLKEYIKKKLDLYGNDPEKRAQYIPFADIVGLTTFFFSYGFVCGI